MIAWTIKNLRCARPRWRFIWWCSYFYL